MASAIAADQGYLASPSQIPIDLFISKFHPGLAPGTIGLTDATGKVIYTVQLHSSKSYKTRIFSHHIRNFTLLNSDGNILMTLIRKENGCWQGYKSTTTNKDMIFLAKKKSLINGVKTQIEVSITGQNGLPEISSTSTTPDLILKGNPSQRACTISDQKSILAQTSLMYKLHQICVGKRKFRLTIYPVEDVDRSLIVSLVIIFVYGKN